ncbi:uncharacterized protein LOC106076356 isoform X10 [Biomphalaria glabrata]|uniref:Uncharacterized protein LOC106076356 isoform X10 n=1 Tax=Biomphalaria glabrata TaxID=6526 RepID=A0A9W3BGC5_BIOGL|nr:uncharacterized protein LOC106076356 isoform X10 [Biomphalaria glabrata]
MSLTVIVTAIVVSGHLLGGQSFSVNNLQLDSENVKRFAPFYVGNRWGGTVVSRRESRNEAPDTDRREIAERFARVTGGGGPGGIVSKREAENEELDSDRAENAKRLAYYPVRPPWPKPILVK